MESEENKKQGPKTRSQQFYSKQDIVEQYCLSDKQLQVLNRVRQPPALFGCISSHRVINMHIVTLIHQLIKNAKNSKIFQKTYYL